MMTPNRSRDDYYGRPHSCAQLSSYANVAQSGYNNKSFGGRSSHRPPKNVVPCRKVLNDGVCTAQGCPYAHTIFTCDLCSIVCTSTSSLAQHQRSRNHARAVVFHEQQMSATSSRTVTPTAALETCEICAMSFESTTALRFHNTTPGHHRRLRNARFRNEERLRAAAKDGLDLPPASQFEIDVVSLKPNVAPQTFRLTVDINNDANAPATLLQPTIANGSPRIIAFAVDTAANPALTIPRKILSNSTTAVSFVYTPRAVGFAQVRIIFSFERDDKEVSIVRIFKANVGDPDIIESLRPAEPYRPPPRMLQVLERSFVNANRDRIIEAPALVTKSSAKYVKQLGDHSPPSSIREILLRPQSKKTTRMIDDIQNRFIPRNPGSEGAHLEYQRTLLWIEEIQMDINIKSYSLEGVTLDRRRGDRFALMVEGLAENRPSVIRADSVFVRLSGNPHARVYEGKAERVEMLEVFLVFHSNFAREFIKGQKYDVEFTFNRIALRRMHEALINNSIFTTLDREFEQLNFMSRAQLSLDQLDGVEKLSFTPFDKKIFENNEQRRAVAIITHGLHAPFPFLLFGPPGTGKTVTLIESIKQIYDGNKNSRLLVCAPSNSAADLLLERLSSTISPREMFRLNAVFRTQQSSFSRMDEYSMRDPDTNCYIAPPLSKLQSYRVIVSTCCSAAVLHGVGIPRGHFTHVFVDESGQGLEPEVLIPLNILDHTPTTKFVLAGDHKQLGPIIHSPIAKHFGLGISVLERFMGYADPNSVVYPALIKKRHQPWLSIKPNTKDETMYKLAMSTVSVKLLNNYRSHPDILRVPNMLFYANELRACADSLITNQYLGWEMLPNPNSPIMFYHVEGKDEREGSSPSWFNVAEIQIVVKLIDSLLSARIGGGSKLAGKDLGVIAPYNRQVQKLRRVLESKAPGVTVGSVDAFQGQERKVIVVSTVRSNPDHLEHDAKYNLGFLSDPKRFNVALTRAKSLCIVVGNARILCQDQYWHAWIRQAVRLDAVRDMPADLTKALRETEPVERITELMSGLGLGNAAQADDHDGDETTAHDVAYSTIADTGSVMSGYPGQSSSGKVSGSSTLKKISETDEIDEDEAMEPNYDVEWRNIE